jgi:hypothetical protein
MMNKYTRCSFCGVEGRNLHVDPYHELTPLCGDCYRDPEKAKATASIKNDPQSWWNDEERRRG